MRPKSNPNAGKVYECFDCGARVEDATDAMCADCGGTLMHIGRSRDL